MTVQTEFLGGLPQLRVIVGPVNIVACCAGHAMAVHHALNEIVALHSVFMCSAIGEVQEVGLPMFCATGKAALLPYSLEVSAIYLKRRLQIPEFRSKETFRKTSGWRGAISAYKGGRLRCQFWLWKTNPKWARPCGKALNRKATRSLWRRPARRVSFTPGRTVIRLSPMLMASSGQLFSLQLPQDLYGTGVYDGRPALATGSTPPADVVVTKYGTFNIAPGPEDAPIAPNTETGPNNFMLNFRLSRTFSIGSESSEKHGGEDSALGPEGRVRGLGGRGLGSGGGSSLGGATNRRYAVTLSMSALNALNNVNLATPVNVLGSPLFGQSIALAGGVYSAQVGNPVANRLVNVSVALSF